jgi:nucleotide-binding universal stress UspA family protein
MGYRTILLHLNSEHRVEPLTMAAIQIAKSTEAHVTGLFVAPQAPFTSPLFPKMSDVAFREELEAYCKTSVAVQQAFESATAGQAIAPEWRQPASRWPLYADTVIAHARTADLVIAGQKDGDWPYSELFDIPEWLAMESGRPVLIIPKGGVARPLASRILIGWNNSREAAKAVFDALPLLVRAEAVHIVSIREADTPATSRDIPAAEIAATLARHDVNVIAENLVRESALDPAQQLMAEADRLKADLIVMGCYGKSRIREFILGGATQHALQHATIPVLMAH